MTLDQSAKVKYAGADYELRLTKIYPEVREGRFEVDMEFIGKEPESIRRGQTLRINLELGGSAPAEDGLLCWILPVVVR